MSAQGLKKAIEELIKYEALGIAPMEAILKLKERFQGTRNLTHRVRGRIAHPAGEGRGIGDLEVELWDRDLIGDDYLGCSVTDAQGRFEILFDPAAAGTGDTPDFELRIFDPPAVGTIDGEKRIRRQIVEVIKPHHPMIDTSTDLGTIELPYFEYDSTVRFPFSSRTSIRRPFVPAAMKVFSDSLAKNAPIDAKINIALNLGRTVTAEEIQAAYPENQTIRMEKSKPGSSRSDDYFVHRLFNGFYPAKAFRRDPTNPRRHTIGYNFDTFELNGHLDLPNFSLDLDINEGDVKLASITLQFRRPGHLHPGSPPQAARTYTPADGDEWNQAKRIFRVFYQGIIGQLQGHVAESHFNMEQYALAMSRNLRKSPLRTLLFPHLKEVININDQGRDLLLGDETGIFPRAKPILMKDQLRWLEKNLGTYDWADWKPRAPMYKGHTYAHGANIYWGILIDFVDEFFTAEADGIEASWAELRAFSDELVARSVPYSADRMEDIQDDRPWADPSELDSSPRPRLSVGGVVHALRPIVTTDHPNEQDIANLKQVCRYCIFYTTWVHGWFHQEQNNEFGELKYGAMLRNGSLGSESDTNILPSPELQSLALRTTNSLQGFTYGYLLKNEDGDVDPRLIERVRAQTGAFQAIGFDLNLLRSRLNA